LTKARLAVYFMPDFLFTKGVPLSNIKSESLVWLDNLAALEAQLQKTPSATHAELAETLNLKRPYVSLLLTLKPILDPAAVEKVRLASNSGFVLSFNGAKALIPLGKLADPSGAVHTALDIILTRRLVTRHIEALVDGMISGKPAESFDSKAKQRPKRAQQVQDRPVHFVPMMKNFPKVGPHGQALLDFLSGLGLKSPDVEIVFAKLLTFEPCSPTGDPDQKEYAVYVKKLFVEYGVKAAKKW
jgi:hypothetical protein